jgi:LysM repeat protein
MFRLGIYRTTLIVGCGLVAACVERPPSVAPTPPPAATKKIYLVVKRGQSLGQIAQTYRVAKDDIVTANQLKPPYSLKPGTVLAIPVVATEAAEPTATQSKLDVPPRTANPDRTKSASAPVRRTKPKAFEQVVIPLGDLAPAQRGPKKPSSSDPTVIPLDDPTPTQSAISNSSTSPVDASSDTKSPHISFPKPVPEP